MNHRRVITLQGGCDAVNQGLNGAGVKQGRRALEPRTFLLVVGTLYLPHLVKSFLHLNDEP